MRPNLPSHAVSDTGALGTTVWQLRRALRRGLRVDPRWEELPMAQVELMQCLAEQPGLKIGQLAKSLRLAPNTVSTLVAQLTGKGLLEAGRDVADGRARLIKLTAAGRQRLEQWQDAHDRMIADAVLRLPSEQRAALIAALPALDSLTTILDGR
jgi:DNA-binding MarR family transcriptional regulator